MKAERVSPRMVVLRVLVLSMLATLAFRLYDLQIFNQDALTRTATNQHVRPVLLPAQRGGIVDDMGRPLVRNRSSLVVKVDRPMIEKESDGGRHVIDRLSALIGVPADELVKRITPCGPDAPEQCWNGSPYQPVPVATDTTPEVALRISEHQEDFPGVTVDTEGLRDYPNGSMAAHLLGYVGPVNQDELDNAAAEGDTGLHEIDLMGRRGLEREYDQDLRGQDGQRDVTIDSRGTVTGVDSEDPPIPGNTLVTSIDRNVQAVVEQALAEQIQTSQGTFDGKNGRNYAAPSGAAVVMDPRTGRIIAMASYPTFDPTMFVGGISQKDLDGLTAEDADVPLVSRAQQGQFAPGSTFKLVTASSIVTDGQTTLDGHRTCPGSMDVGGRPKTNYEEEAIPGPVDLRTALAKSCDTYFYQFAMDAWHSDQQKVDNGQNPDEYLQAMARAYGFGEPPGVDLPEGEQTAGRIADRQFKQDRWEASKDQYCADAAAGYPDVKDSERRDFLTRLASENCTDGWRYRIGDHADLAIGQGETTVSPLQLATAYCALVNGGTLYQPTIGRAIINPNGDLVREITPEVRRQVPVPDNVLQYIRDSLTFNRGLGVSGESAYSGFPLDKHPVGAKTGTAEVFGKQDTSWIATWAPADAPRFVVVGMIEQAGLGSGASGPMTRRIYDGIFGVEGHQPTLADGKVPADIPDVKAYGPDRTNAPSGTAGPSGESAPGSGSPSSTNPDGSGAPAPRPTGGTPGPAPDQGSPSTPATSPTGSRPSGRRAGRPRAPG